jgi:hypothetical protein
MAVSEKIPSEKILLQKFFAAMQGFKQIDDVLDSRVKAALSALFQPGTVAPAEYFQFMKKNRLRAGKHLCSRCWKMPSAASKTRRCSGEGREEMVSGKRRNGLNEEESEWIFYFENICETLWLDPQGIPAIGLPKL